MSQKLSEEVEKELEELRELISFYFGQDEIRYRFSVMKFYEVMIREGRKDYKKDYEKAKAKYDALFPKDSFSMNRKT